MQLPWANPEKARRTRDRTLMSPSPVLSDPQLLGGREPLSSSRHEFFATSLLRRPEQKPKREHHNCLDWQQLARVEGGKASGGSAFACKWTRRHGNSF